MDLFFLTSSVFSSQEGSRSLREAWLCSLPLSLGLVVCPGEVV